MSDAYVSAAKKKELATRMARLGIEETDLVEKFVLGSGRGGQKVNKTSSCVYLRHVPTGIEIKCQRGRSQSLNRHHARVELCDRIQEQIRGEMTARKQRREKIRRQKRRRSRRQKEKMLADKKKQSVKKQQRRRVGPEE